MMIDTGPKFYSAVLAALANDLKVTVKKEFLYYSDLRAHIF